MKLKIGKIVHDINKNSIFVDNGECIQKLIGYNNSNFKLIKLSKRAAKDIQHIRRTHIKLTYLENNNLSFVTFNLDID